MVYVIKPKAQEGGSGHTTLKSMAEKLVEDRSIDKRKGRLSEPTWGESVESPGTIIGIVGWESVEAVSKLQLLVIPLVLTQKCFLNKHRPKLETQTVKSITSF